MIRDCIPGFVGLAIFGLGFVASMERAVTVAGVALILGLVCGFYAVNVMRRNLLHGEGHFLTSRAPGGIWFFVGCGVLLGAILFAMFILWPGSENYSLLFWGVFTAAVFGLLALFIRRIEDMTELHVILDGDGFFFEDP